MLLDKEKKMSTIRLYQRVLVEPAHRSISTLYAFEIGSLSGVMATGSE